MNTIYQLPTWAETVLIICIAMMLTSIGVWLMCKAVTEAVNAASRLETKRRKSDTKALNKWQRLYEEEHKLRADDNAMLIAQLTDLQCENKRMKQILKKAKVADIDTFGSITPMEAFMQYGITKLATRVSELIRQGERISKEPAEAKNRYGQTVRFMRYRRA